MTKIIKQKKVKKEMQHLNVHLEDYNTREFKYEKFSIRVESIISIISDLAPYVILLYAAYEIIQGRFQIGTLVAFSMLVSRFLDPVKELAGKELEFQTLEVTAKRIFSIMKDKKYLKSK
ncbi:MAG: hypothetical protein ABIG89_07545 [Candidatus Woesearchaeota archaeon]